MRFQAGSVQTGEENSDACHRVTPAGMPVIPCILPVNARWLIWCSPGAY